MSYRSSRSAVLILLLLTCVACSSDPGARVRAVPDTVLPEPQSKMYGNAEVPRETAVALQRCADRHASRLSADSSAILFDVKVNSSGQTTAVNIKDSMVAGSDIERCLTDVLERMVVPGVAMTAGHDVSPVSRSMVGVIQVAVAPIALTPIVLVAAGVTILVGVTIYVATEAIDAARESQRCREVKDKCIDHCSGPAGLPAPGGGRFRQCMRECMQSHGCSF